MDPTMWDCQTVHGGGSLTNFQRQVLGDLYGGRKSTHREDERFMRGARRMRRAAVASGSVALPRMSWLAAMPALVFPPLAMSAIVIWLDFL
jgi:hypothetical protein